MSQTNLHQAAIGYLLAHQGEHLHRDRHHLLSRCTDHLRETHSVSDVSARVATLTALGEIEARGKEVHIDLNRTTSYTVFVVDPASKTRVAFTAASLLRLARAELAAATSTAH